MLDTNVFTSLEYMSALLPWVLVVVQNLASDCIADPGCGSYLWFFSHCLLNHAWGTPTKNFSVSQKCGRSRTLWLPDINLIRRFVRISLMWDCWANPTGDFSRDSGVLMLILFLTLLRWKVSGLNFPPRYDKKHRIMYCENFKVLLSWCQLESFVRIFCR